MVCNLGKWRQEDQKYRASLGYIVSPSLAWDTEGEWEEEERGAEERRGEDSHIPPLPLHNTSLIANEGFY